MGISIQCPCCRQTYVLNTFLAGRRVRCQRCKEEFTAPSPTVEIAPQIENDRPLPPPLPTTIQSESAPATGIPCPTLGCDVSGPQLSRSLRRSRAILLLSVALGAVAVLLLGIVLDRFVLPHDSTGDRIDERSRQPEASAGKARNLLVNGSFEEGPALPKLGGFHNQLDKGSAAVAGWVVSQGNIDAVDSSYWKAADGKRSLDLNGIMPGTISQTFKTKKGQKYRVTFALAGNPGHPPTVKKLQVSAKARHRNSLLTRPPRRETTWAG